MRRPALLTGLVAALVLLPATAASAHPAFNPNQLPAGEPVDTVLVVPHGCSTADEVMPDQGSAVPTTRFDLQVVDGVMVEPGDVEGWDVVDDGEAIVWTDTGGATTEPIEFPMTLTVTDGSAGDTVLLAAHQECEDGSSYRWTEGSPSTPPVRLEVTAGETGTAATDTEDTGHGAADPQPEPEGTPGDTAATDAPSEDVTEATTAAGDGGIDGATVAAVLAVGVAVAAGIVSLVRRRRTA